MSDDQKVAWFIFETMLHVAEKAFQKSTYVTIQIILNAAIFNWDHYENVTDTLVNLINVS